MYRITTTAGDSILTEKVTYIRVHKSGVYLITDQGRAEGVAYHGTPYMFADGAQVHEVDAGETMAAKDDVQAVWDQMAAAYAEGVNEV